MIGNGEQSMVAAQTFAYEDVTQFKEKRDAATQDYNGEAVTYFDENLVLCVNYFITLQLRIIGPT